MRWWQRASKRSSWILGLRALGITAAIGPQTSWTAERKLQLREDVKSLWYHGFDNYMAFGEPSCCVLRVFGSVLIRFWVLQRFL